MADASLPGWLDTAAGLITVAGAAAGAAIFFTRSLFHLKEEKLKAQLAETEKAKAALEERYRQVLEAGNLIANMKQAIDDEFALMADRVGAAAGAVFVPAPSFVPEETPRELVFFSVLGGAGAMLKRERVPIAESDAGKAFTTGEPLLSGRSAKSPSFSEKTDRAANFQTETKVSIPLIHRRKCVGVAQFLNKEGGAFSDADLATLVRHRDLLAARVGEFVKDPENLRRLGITPRESAAEATILFSDLSNSSRLMRSLDTSQVVDMFNQYFEELGNVALGFGGTIDQFLGDGFLVTFNVRRPVAEHEVNAVRAALEMQQSFAAIKKRWVALGYRETPHIFNRIGISTGAVKKAELGHSQYRCLTVMGEAVNDARYLCDLGERSRNVIMLSAEVRAKLPEGVTARPTGSAASGEAFELEAAIL